MAKGPNTTTGICGQVCVLLLVAAALFIPGHVMYFTLQIPRHDAQQTPPSAKSPLRISQTLGVLKQARTTNRQDRSLALKLQAPTKLYAPREAVVAANTTKQASQSVLANQSKSSNTDARGDGVAALKAPPVQVPALLHAPLVAASAPPLLRKVRYRILLFPCRTKSIQVMGSYVAH